jgi:hypothetical protein
MHMTLKSFRYVPGENALYIVSDGDRLRFKGVDGACGAVAARWLKSHVDTQITLNFICNGAECVLVLEDYDQDRLTIRGLS